MQTRNSSFFCYAVILFFILPAANRFVEAQSAHGAYPVFELGGVSTGLAGNGLGADAGLGGRATYLLAHDSPDDEIQGMLGIEAEINWLPVSKSPTFFRGGRALEGLFRFKAEMGDVDERIGLKLGSGFVRSNSAVLGIAFTGNPLQPAVTPTRLGSLTEPAIEFGVLFEKFRPNSHWGVRFDAGDVIVIYPEIPGSNNLHGKQHFQFSTSLVYRFPLGRGISR